MTRARDIHRADQAGAAARHADELLKAAAELASNAHTFHQDEPLHQCVVTRFIERCDAGEVTPCPHLAAGTVSVRVWYAGAPGRLWCWECAQQSPGAVMARIVRAARRQTGWCDICDRGRRPLDEGELLTLHEQTILVSAICLDCVRSPGGEAA